MEWNTAFQKYKRTLLSKKTVIIVYLLVFLWEDIVSRIIEVAAQANCKPGLLEPYILIMTDCSHVLLIPLLFLVLLYDFPVSGLHERNIMYRTGKKRWHAGQAIYIFWLALTELLMIFGSFLIEVFRYAEAGNKWSPFTVTLYYENPELYEINNQLFIQTDVVAQGSPVEVFFHSTFLAILLMMAIGQAVLFFHVINQKSLGRILIIFIILTGWVTAKLQIWLQWLFPISHILYGNHFNTILSKGNCSLWVSYVYFIILNLVLFILCKRKVKECVLW